MSAAQHPGHATTIALNHAADTLKCVPQAAGHYAKTAASHDLNKVKVQSIPPVDYPKKSSRPKRQDETQPIRIASAPQIAVHNSMTMRHVSSGSLNDMITIFGICLEIEILLLNPFCKGPSSVAMYVKRYMVYCLNDYSEISDDRCAQLTIQYPSDKSCTLRV